MNELEDQLLEIGSRSGATVALFFFAALFLVLGWAVSKALRRHGISPMMAGVAGFVLFILPMSMIYSSSLSGFYDIERPWSWVTLKHLVPMVTEALPRSAVLRVEARPAFRGQWRVHVTTVAEVERYSALARRDSAIRAARVMKDHLLKTRM